MPCAAGMYCYSLQLLGWRFLFLQNVSLRIFNAVIAAALVGTAIYLVI